MNRDDLQPELRLRAAGAVFHRCALQVNPHHYAGTYRGQPNEGGPDEYARRIVDKAVELGISVLAITDHNDVASLAEFRTAAEGRDVHVFPGFELASSEGVHVLCIYPPETSTEQLRHLLGTFGITEPGSSTKLANKRFVEILRMVREQGGVAIAAHATNNGGLFGVLKGQARIEAWRCKDLLAIQIPGLVEDLPPDVRQIVENKDPHYRRDHPADERLAVAVVNCKDVASPEDLEDRSATCWIKMSRVGIEGLRQAFLDPGSRIRLNPKDGRFQPEEHVELVEIAWEGGFLDGCRIRFNPNLNILIGGRGAGKSTVIESIRAVLGLAPLGDDARKAHEGIVRQVLRNGTRISLRVRVPRPTARQYTVERTLPNPPVVKEASGRLSNLVPRDLLPRIQIFGQHEISELTKSPAKLTHLLDRFVERDETLSRRKSELRRELEKNRRRLLEVRKELDDIDERLSALPGLEETLKQYKEAGLEEKLKERSLLVREERILETLEECLAPFRECLQYLKQELPIDRTFLSAKALQELPGREILARLDPVLETLEKELQKVAASFESALQRAEADVAAVRKDWQKRKEQVQAAYESILRDLQKARVDGEEFIRLRRRIEELRPLRERQRQMEVLERELTERRRSLLVEWEDLKAEEFRRLDRAAKRVTRKLRNQVQVEVTAAGNREPLFALLRDRVGGRLSEAIERLRQVEDLSLPRFVEACRSGADELVDLFGIPQMQAERLANTDPETLMEIEELDLPPTTTIRLNTAPLGERPSWQTLEDLSAGQKATAVLLLLLLESDAPLVVDQPEDDLDNRFVTEGVVPRMREEKQRRQFIFATHNANIPVLGDAELVVGLAASGEAEGGRACIPPEHVGSIDDPPVRELIEEVLEGGKEAFERRRRKYGF